MAYKLSIKAEEDIVNIYQEGVLRFGDLQAEKYHVELEGVFDFLADNSKAARERWTCPILVPPYGSHVIIYIIDQLSEVYILHVRHGREDWVRTSS